MPLLAYRNAARTPSLAHTADAKAGELCYRMGDYDCSGDLLAKALRYDGWTAEQTTRLTTMRHDADRLQELAASLDLALSVRVAHLQDDGHIAQARLKACIAQQASVPADAGALKPFEVRWKTLASPKIHNALLHDDDLRSQFAAFIDDTEDAVTRVCGAPAGDDALLAYLQDHPATHFGVQ